MSIGQMKPVLGSLPKFGGFPQPVGLWLFNEGTGDKVYDLSGNGNVGNLQADTHFVPGKFGHALDFDGTGDYIDLGNPLNMEPTDFVGLSIVLWVYRNGTGVWDSLVDKGNAFAAASNMAINFGIRSNDFIRFRVSNGSAIDGIETGGTLIGSGNWHQYVGTWTGDTRIGGMKVYEDAVQIENDTVSFDISTLKTGDNWYFVGNSLSLAGQVDHVMIFNRALTASEIVQLYVNSFPWFQRDPIELWSAAQVAPSVANPRGPLGHPLHGALAGPISF